MRPTHVAVDLSAIHDNAGILARACAPGALCAVVKADAYGHGLVPVARAALAGGARWLAVALVEEGVALRQAGLAAPILVLAGHYGGAYEAVVAHRLTPVVGQAADLTPLSQAAARAGRRLGVHIELDSGMGRLGVRPEGMLALARAAEAEAALQVEGIMTHLSHSDVQAAPSTERQLQLLEGAFAELRPHLPGLRLCHILNSGGLVTAAAHRHEIVRCGLALYGVQPVAEGSLGTLRPALSWRTRPVALRTLGAGDPVSYGSHWRAARPSRIATLPVGYADGYGRLMTHRAHVLMRGRRVPVVGTICMDLCMVDVTDLEAGGAAPITLDDEVVLLGTQGDATLDANTLAAWAETIPYEILARIGPRVPRVYFGADAWY